MQLLSSLSSVLKRCARILWRLWLRFPACVRWVGYNYIARLRRIGLFKGEDLRRIGLFKEEDLYHLPFGLRLEYIFEEVPEIGANNLKFVRENTSIPGIPDVLDVVPSYPGCRGRWDGP